MLTVKGIYKDGRVELLEAVNEVKQAKVLVTFVESANDIQLKSIGIDEHQAGELREKFAAFEDWNDPAMDTYNDYDGARSVFDGQN